MSDSPYIREGTAGNFDELVLANSHKGVVLVDFWAPWVGPSHRQKPMLQELAQEMGGRVLLVTVNTDTEKALAKALGITSLPTARVYLKGEVVHTFHGVQPQGDYRDVLNGFQPSSIDPALASAVALYQAGDAEGALTILAEATRREPENLEFPLLAAKILIRYRDFAQAEAILKTLPDAVRARADINAMLTHAELANIADQPSAPEEPADPDAPEARLRAAAAALQNDDFPAALSLLLELAARDREYRDEIGRRGMLAIFHILGEQHPLTQHFRKRLVNELNA